VRQRKIENARGKVRRGGWRGGWMLLVPREMKMSGSGGQVEFGRAERRGRRCSARETKMSRNVVDKGRKDIQIS